MHPTGVIFMDEIDAIGGKRQGEGSSADREIQRTLMELLNQLDGFEALGQVKIVMATNRPDILDSACKFIYVKHHKAFRTEHMTNLPYQFTTFQPSSTSPWSPGPEN